MRDVYYEEKTECLTAIGLSYDPYDPAMSTGPSSAPALGDGNELQRVYAQFMLDHRMSPSNIPYALSLNEEEAVEYMKNPRVTMVQLWMRTNLKNQYRVAEENGLLDKIFISFFDEPGSEEKLNYILDSTVTMHETCPGFHSMDAIYLDLRLDGRNIIERLSDVTDMYCPKIQNFTGEIRETMLKLKAERGDTLFWYVCNGNETPGTINRLPCTPGTDKRLLFWQQYQQNVDGFLYWRATCWNGHEDVWSENYMTKKRNFFRGGGWPTDEGVLLYWHPETGMPVSTLGFEAMRDGIEDFQLMKMVEAVYGRDTVLTYVEQLTTDVKQYVRYEEGSTPLLEGLKNQLFDLLDPAA